MTITLWHITSNQPNGFEAGRVGPVLLAEVARASVSTKQQRHQLAKQPFKRGKRSGRSRTKLSLGRPNQLGRTPYDTHSGSH
jgi:hypothetical protein